MQRLLLLFSVFVVLAFAIRIVLTPEAALDFASEYRDFATMYTWSTMFLIGLLYAIAFALTIPITTLLALLSGFLFGLNPSLLLVGIATIVGALGIFLPAKIYPNSLCRFFVGESHDRLLTWALSRPISYMLATRFAPLVPFPVAHLIPAEARVRTRDFLWTTLLGTMPASAVFIAVGAGSHVLATGEPIMAKTYLIGLLIFSATVLGVLFLTHRENVKSAIQEMRKMRPSRKNGRHETTDA